MTDSFVTAFVIAAVTAFIVAITPAWLAVAGAVLLGAGIAVMANIPEESVPDWLKPVKKGADGIADKAVKMLKEGPVSVVEDIGQGLMDEIQTPEGIASVAGGTVGTLAGGYAGSRVNSALKVKDKYSSLGKMAEQDGKRYNQYWDDVAKNLDTESRVKLNQWKYRPDADLYNQYKKVYDNPKYYNQQSGEINWPPNDGFVSKHKSTAKVGEIFDRYGFSNGQFMAPEGTPYKQRALAPHSSQAEYHKYEVKKSFDIIEGKTASYFDEPGGGRQLYGIDKNGKVMNVKELVRKRYLREIK